MDENKENIENILVLQENYQDDDYESDYEYETLFEDENYESDEPEEFRSDDEEDEEVHETMSRLYKRWSEFDQEMKNRIERQSFVLSVLYYKEKFIEQLRDIARATEEGMREYLDALFIYNEYKKNKRFSLLKESSVNKKFIAQPHPLAYQFPPHFTYSMIEYVLNPDTQNREWQPSSLFSGLTLTPNLTNHNINVIDNN